MSTRTQAALLIDTHHPLPEPLIPDGTPKETDTTALQAAIAAWERSGRPDSLGDLEAFLDQHPQSAWSLALQANLGILCASQAQFGKALDKNISGWGATESAVIGAVSGLIGGEVGSSATLDDLFNPESLGRGTLASLFSGINYNKAAKEVWRAL